MLKRAIDQLCSSLTWIAEVFQKLQIFACGKKFSKPLKTPNMGSDQSEGCRTVISYVAQYVHSKISIGSDHCK